MEEKNESNRSTKRQKTDIMSESNFDFTMEEFERIQEDPRTLSLFQTGLAGRIESLREAAKREGSDLDGIIRLAELLGYAKLRFRQLKASASATDAPERTVLIAIARKSFENSEELVTAVDFYVKKTPVYFESIVATYGPIGQWDVSKVKSFYSLFGLDRLSSAYAAVTKFNEDISEWNVSSGEDFSYMFDRNCTFHGDLSKWNVCSATNMQAMFRSASALTCDLGLWDVSNVTNMSNMFEESSAFKCDLSNWKVSNVTDMSSMFMKACVFESNLDEWNMSNVIYMDDMFRDAAAFYSKLSEWKVSKVRTMKGMFFGASSFRGDLAKWDVSNVEDTQDMFRSASAFDCDLSKWNVSKVESMMAMFREATAFRGGGLEHWDVSKVELMDSMFQGATAFNCDLSRWKTSNLIGMNFMFCEASSFQSDLGSWDISKAGEGRISIFDDAPQMKGRLPRWAKVPWDDDDD